MDSKLTHEAHIYDLGEIYSIEVPFDEALKLFKKNDLELISARDLAFARINAHPNLILAAQHSLSQNGSYVKEGVLYIPKTKNRIMLVRESIVLADSSAAVQAHKSGSEFSVHGMDYLQNIIGKGNSLILKDLTPVPTDRFAEDERTVFIFQDQAGKYGLFLKDNGIGAMPLCFDSENYIDNHKEPYANQLWLGRLGNGSRVNGDNRGLGYNFRARGVQRQTAEGGSQKILYTQEELGYALDLVNGIKSGELGTSKLEEIVHFLSKLRKD